MNPTLAFAQLIFASQNLLGGVKEGPSLWTSCAIVNCKREFYLHSPAPLHLSLLKPSLISEAGMKTYNLGS